MAAGGLALACSGAHAEAGPPPIAVVKLHLDYRINADASYVETSEIVQRLNSPAAVRSAGQVRVPYSSSLDEFQLLEAVTLKADGRRIAVPGSAVYTQDGSISAEGVTSFQDIRTTVVVYPDLAAGDSILLKTRITRKKPVLPGTFTLARAFPGDFPFEDVQIAVSAPKSLPLSVENTGVAFQRLVDEGQALRRIWSYQNRTIEPTEASAVDALMYRPRLLVSTLSTYSQLAAAASQRFAGRAEVTPSIRKQANEIVAGARSRREEAQKLYEWVTRNVRYFAVVLDIGGYQPRLADEVLASRHGDCKDHAVLLQALLAARGFTSYPALIGTGALYELPKVPVLAAFDHVINYVPELNLFLDSNTGITSFGQLPAPDVDKPVVLLAGAQTAAMRTPRLRPETNRNLVSTQITIRPDGRASGQDSVQAIGTLGLGFAAWADTLGGQDPVRVAREFLLNAQLSGEGTVSIEPFDAAKGFNFTLLYELRGFVDPTRAGGLRVVPPLDPYQRDAREIVAETDIRAAPYQCGSRDEASVITLVFPPGARLSLPQGVTATAPYRSYQSRYQLTAGNVVRIDRRYRSDLPRRYCLPAEFAESRALQERILEDLRAEIGYELPGARR